MQPAKQIKYVQDPDKFDLRTHVWDSQGLLVQKNLYRKYIMSGSEYYERPVNSGNLWFANNQPAGRVLCEFNDKGHIIKKEFDFTAPHVEYVPAPSGAEKIAAELSAARAELAAIKAEQAAKLKDVQSEATESASPKLSKRG